MAPNVKSINVTITYKKNDKVEVVTVPLFAQEEEKTDKTYLRIKSNAVERGQKGRAYKMSAKVDGLKYFGTFFYDL
jgi:hypothetical protein